MAAEAVMTRAAPGACVGVCHDDVNDCIHIDSGHLGR